MCRVEIEDSNPRNDLADRNRGLLLAGSHAIITPGSVNLEF